LAASVAYRPMGRASTIRSVSDHDRCMYVPLYRAGPLFGSRERGCLWYRPLLAVF
jgi:hypothetical protein